MQRGSLQFLVFEVGGQRHALPVADVQELLRAVSIVPLPRAPAIVEGIINLRGRIVPILDVRSRFRLPAKPLEQSDHFIVVHAAEHLVALRVDRAVDLVPLEAEEIADARSVVPGVANVSGLARLAHDLVLIPDLLTLLTREESEALDDTVPAVPPRGETGGGRP